MTTQFQEETKVNRRLHSTVALLSLAIIFLLFCSTQALAKTKPSKAVASHQKQVFETKIDLGLFGLLGGGMNYYLDGKTVTKYQDFKRVIYPLRDEEASKLIRDAEEADFVSWIIFGLGVATGVDIALIYKPVPVLGVDWMDRISTGAVASQAFIGLSFVFKSHAEGLKYNAIQRYNHLVRGEEMTSLNVTPQLFADGGHLGLGLIGRF